MPWSRPAQDKQPPYGLEPPHAETNRVLQGGFIWDWVDQGLLHELKDAAGNIVDAWGYGGDFGDPVHDAQFNINGLIWPNRQPHPGCWECKAVMVSHMKPSLELSSRLSVCGKLHMHPY